MIKIQSKQTRTQRIKRALKRDKYLFLLFAPIFIYYFIFKYLPISGVIIAFKDFKPGMGIYDGDWVGLKWFIQFFESPFAYRLIRNTVLLAAYSILFGFPVPIIFAICVTEITNTKIRRTVQTVSYLPHFISTVVLAGMIKNILDVNSGVVNNFISLLGCDRINFMMDYSWFRTIYVSSGVWQSFGFNSIIYIAAIIGIDPSLYESAKIDGITKFKEVFYITLPTIVSSYNIMVCRSAFSAIPDEVMESAFIDGANDIQILSKIAVRLITPTIAVLTLYYAVGHWNNFFTAFLYLSKQELQPLQVILRRVLILASTEFRDKSMVGRAEQYTATLQVRYATIVVATLPILAIYPFIQKYFVKGVMLGAVKG
jgi:putative aldouronate transport system permease protein